MSIDWKKGPPPSTQLEMEGRDKWLLIDRERGYYAFVDGPPEEESPAPSPREGAEGSEGEGGGKGAPCWTSGPWGTGNTIGGSIMVFADRAGGNEARGMIASCDAGNYARSAEEGRANARLIAAAPELCEALDKLYALVNGECPSLLDSDSGGDDRLFLEIEDALAKARGEGS